MSKLVLDVEIQSGSFRLLTGLRVFDVTSLRFASAAALSGYLGNFSKSKFRLVARVVDGEPKSFARAVSVTSLRVHSLGVAGELPLLIKIDGHWSINPEAMTFVREATEG